MLDSHQEKVLQKINNDLCKNEDISVSSSEGYLKEEIDSLIILGYIKKKIDTSSKDGWSYIIVSTHKGLTYLNTKKKREKIKQRKQIEEWVKFIIPVIISIISLTVSIIVAIVK